MGRTLLSAALTFVTSRVHCVGAAITRLKINCNRWPRALAPHTYAKLFSRGPFEKYPASACPV